MTFLAQEQALFDLLFDRDLRAAFCQNPVNALVGYELEESEISDFLCIRPDALELDAAIRIDLILAQMCRQYPVTFGILSSFAGGMECLQALVNSALMRSKPLQRNVHFGSGLREKITTLKYTSTQEYALLAAVLEAELAMAFTSASLKEAVINQQLSDDNTINVPQNWLVLPVELALYVSAGVMPLPYAQLKQLFCPCNGLDLWRQLSVTPIAAKQRIQVFQKPDARLFLARALVTYPSPCEPIIDFSTVELSEGFAPLFQYVNGEHTIAEILEQLQQAGAQGVMLESIKSRFMQLLESGLLKVREIAVAGH